MDDKQKAYEDARDALEVAWADAMAELHKPAPKDDIAINQNAAHAERIYWGASHALEIAAAALDVEWKPEDFVAATGACNKAEFRCDVHPNHDRLWASREKNLCLVNAVSKALADK